MKRSIGTKRRWLDEIIRQQIVELYVGDRLDPDHARLIDSQDLGYQAVQVFFPLRLNFQLSMDRIDQMLTHHRWRKLRPQVQATTLKVMGLRERQPSEVNSVEQSEPSTELTGRGWDGTPTRCFHSQSAFLNELEGHFEIWDIPAEARIALMWGLGEEDPEAEVFSPEGRPLFSDHRDSERIPLTQTIDEFFEQWVWPHRLGAEPDLDTLKIGYEINFRKIFYQPVKLRSPEAIMEDIQAISAEMQPLLADLF